MTSEHDFLFVHKKLSSYFNKHGINIPEEDFIDKKDGRIKKCGWTICYKFDSDERGDYVVIYSDHRMCGSDLDKCYINGYEVPFKELIDYHEGEENYRSLYDAAVKYGVLCT